MEHASWFGHLNTDDIVCPWWKDTNATFSLWSDYSPIIRDESPEAVAQAKAQWTRSVENNIPGFAISPFPHMFMVRLPKGVWNSLASPEGSWEAVGRIPWEVSQDRSKWTKFKLIRLNEVFDYSDYGEGWSYASIARRIAPKAKPHPWDMPNPRLYWPNGTLAYMPRNDRFHVGPWLQFLFRRALVNLWGDATMSNKRTDTLGAFLDHHRTRGRAPERFIEYVQSLVLLQPSEFDAVLLEKLKAWCQEATKIKGVPKPSPITSLVDLLGEPLTARLFAAMNAELEGKRIISTGREYLLGHTSKGAVTASVDAAFTHAGSTPPPDEEYRKLLSRTFKNFSIGKGKLHYTRNTREATKWKAVIAARLNA